MEQQISASEFDPAAWDGEYDDLLPWRDRLLGDWDLCERTFCSEGEAFSAGLYLGEALGKPGRGCAR